MLASLQAFTSVLERRMMGLSRAGDIAGCGHPVQCGDEFQVAEASGGVVLGVSRHPGGPALAVSHGTTTRATLKRRPYLLSLVDRNLRTQLVCVQIAGCGHDLLARERSR